ncbi:glutathione peroxidase [Danxiaibacter flavus]|uniref:Glutathione peroxidase n=1 Tax=Danxiaibacter flavus TaxID=3049108 RepID=A0ABV3ZNS4_9BACT|nr:glutathione peroxidase [Chitinophagaceae bacterium DXS]
MTFKQKLLRLFYPLLMRLSASRRRILENTGRQIPVISFHSLQTLANNGRSFAFDQLKGRKVLLVNTASDCGYTAQYAELEQLNRQFNNILEIIAFPTNDFKEQEKGTDEEIERFCKMNYGITFPIMKKSSVLKGAGQNEIFEWLTNKDKNGWNDKDPSWNFSKYLVNEEGILTHYFEPAVSPMDEEVKKAIKQ